MHTKTTKQFKQISTENLTVPQRLDLVLSQEMPDYSRSYLQKLIHNKLVSINGSVATKPRLLVKPGDIVEINISDTRARGDVLPLPSSELGIHVIHEQPEFLIVFKPAGIMVHIPHFHSTEITVVDWLVHHFAEIKDIGDFDRPGIVHRLDKDTSGLLVVPRTTEALTYFTNLFKTRSIRKTYLALVHGQPSELNKWHTVQAPITRDPHNRHKMAIAPYDNVASISRHISVQSKIQRYKSRPTLTHYRAIAYYDNSALVEVQPITGRTHQIRVHLAAAGYPIIGDQIYGSATDTANIERQALHAYKLTFTFNDTHYVFWHSMPADMQHAIMNLRKKVDFL